VVFIHGIPTNPRLWRHVVPQLGRIRALCFEMVGYGDSIPAGHDRDISVARQADYLIAWLDELDVHRAVFAGHDLGGGVAQIAAVRHPDRCAGLMLTNSIGYDSWPIPMVTALRATRAVIARMPGAGLRVMLRMFMRLGHDRPSMAEEALDVHLPPYLRHNGAAAFARQVRWLDVHDTLDVADSLPRLDVPARAVWGAAYQFQKLPYGARLAWDLNTTIEAIEGGKHWSPEDHPDRIAAAVTDVAGKADL